MRSAKHSRSSLKHSIFDGDCSDDLIGLWPGQGGIWVKYSSDGTWERLSSTARDIAAGKMRPAEGLAPPGAGETLEAAQAAIELPFPMGGFEEGLESAPHKKDHSMDGPGGWRFVYLEERNLEPKEASEASLRRIPSPGEPGFVWVEQENIFPKESIKKSRETTPGRKDLKR